MNRHYRIMYVLIAVSLAASVVLLLLMDDVVPAHYDSTGAVTRYASRFEYLLFPLLAALLGGLSAYFARWLSKHGATLLEKDVLYIGICLVLTLTALGAVLMIKTMQI